MSEVAVKPGRHREATLYHALAGDGAGDGRTLAQLREAALAHYYTSELPVWRRSGFWTTTLRRSTSTRSRINPIRQSPARPLPERRRRSGPRRGHAHAARAPARGPASCRARAWSCTSSWIPRWPSAA